MTAIQEAAGHERRGPPILQRENKECTLMSEERDEREGRRIDTGGGSCIGGDVHAGRDFVGRDRVEVPGKPV